MRLAAAYAKPEFSEGTIAAFAFDRALGAAVSRASESIAGQIRLAWWRELLCGERRSEAGSDAIASAISHLARDGRIADAFGRVVNGWERLFLPFPLSDESLLAYAQERGNGLFEAVAALSGECVPPSAGQGWALTDFAFRCSDPETAANAIELARSITKVETLPRPLAVLSRFARRDARRGLERGSGEGTPLRLLDAIAAGLTRT